ncbi:MAG: hypothetical protein ACTHM2_10660 [Afipia sp.]|jgi:hypothetical protein
MTEAAIPVTKQDRFTASFGIGLILLAMWFTVLNELDRIFNLYLLIVPFLFFPAAALGLRWLGSLLSSIWHRRWRRAVSAIVAPMIAYGLIQLVLYLGFTPGWIRFELGKQHYLAEVEKLPRGSEPRFKVFNWGQTGGAAVVNIFFTLVFDESDEIAFPPEKRSSAWSHRMTEFCPGTAMCSILKPDSPTHHVAIEKVSGHFYLVTELYR